MRGLDGNYLNAQGDALSRMQNVYQSEQTRQQLQAQLGAQDALRKLREQVNGPETSGDAAGPRVVGEDGGGGKGPGADGSSTRRKPTDHQGEDFEGQGMDDVNNKPHIDIRV